MASVTGVQSAYQLSQGQDLWRGNSLTTGEKLWNTVDVGLSTAGVLGSVRGANMLLTAPRTAGSLDTIAEGYRLVPYYPPVAVPPTFQLSTSLNAASGSVTRFVTNKAGQTVDLGPTLERIRIGGTFPHRNDGSVFRNLEGGLPRKPTGYYREFVHPSPGIKGPGPQRVVVGQGGETFFTPDHYRNFIPLNP